MCGIFSYVAKPGKVANLNTLERLAVETEKRGPHAFGLAWIDSRNRLQHYKRPGRISDHLYVFDQLRDARMLIGHTRYVTQGCASYNSNNHPHPVDGGWLVHNGRIEGYQDLISCYDLMPNTECDSEVISLLIEKFDGPLLDRCMAAATHCSLTDFAMIGLWNRPARMIIAKAGKPLHVSRTSDGWYYASKPKGLPGYAREVKNNRCIMFSRRKASAPKITRWDLDRLPTATRMIEDDSAEYATVDKPELQQQHFNDFIDWNNPANDWNDWR